MPKIKQDFKILLQALRLLIKVYILIKFKIGAGMQLFLICSREGDPNN